MSRDDFLNAESSGGLKGFTLTVDDAFFAIDQKYSEKVGKDTYFLHWIGRSDADGHEIMGVDGFHPKWALDPDFASLDGGKTVQSPTKGNKVGKAYGRMCAIAANATVELKDTPEDFLASASPLSADIWKGTIWVLDEHDTDFGGTIGKITELMPMRYVGRSDQPAAAPAAPAPAAAPQAPVQPPLAPVPDAPADNSIRAQVKALAAASQDYRSFQAAALQLVQSQNATGDSALLSDIANEQAIWAEVKGS